MEQKNELLEKRNRLLGSTSFGLPSKRKPKRDQIRFINLKANFGSKVENFAPFYAEYNIHGLIFWFIKSPF